MAIPDHKPSNLLKPALEGSVLLELVLLGAVLACGIWIFFGRAFATHFDLHPGDLGDWRYCNIILEHWYSVFKGEAEWRSPAFFYPAKLTLGYSDSLFLFVPFYIPLRVAGLEPSLAFVFCFMSVIALGFLTSYWFMSRILGFAKILSLGASFAFVFSNMAGLRYPHVPFYAYSFLPILLAMGVRLVESVLEQRPSTRYGVGFGVGLAALLYTGFYVGYFLMLFLLCFFSVFLAVNSWLAWPSTRRIFHAFWAARNVLVASAVSFAIALIPFLMTYLPTLREVRGRDWGMVECMLPLPRDFLNAAGNFWWSWMLRRFPAETRPCGWELTFGIPPITLGVFALCLVWLCYMLYRSHALRPVAGPGHETGVLNTEQFRLRVAFALGFAVLACWLLMLRLDYGSLWYFVHRFLPAAAALRAVFRFQIVLLFIIVIVIGFTLPKMVAHWPRKRASSFVALAIGAIAIEQYNQHHLHFRGAYEATQIARAAVPPSSCKQFFVDSAGLEDSPGHIGSLAAAIIAQRVGIPTLNGYSGSLPTGFTHTETRDPIYLTRVATWARAHRLIDGSCMLDLPRKSWREMSAILSDIAERLLGKNVLSFEDRMQDFAILRVGFQPPEPPGAWTAGNASVEFSRPVAGATKVVITGHRGYAGQPLTFRVDDQSVTVDPANSKFRIEIATARPVSAVRIETDHFVPSARGIGADTRQLGVYVESIVLEK